MQHEIVKSAALLDKNGNIAEPGWARSLISRYSRADIKAHPIRIKEWDYYLISNDRFALALTIADNGYMGLISASVLDLKAVGADHVRNDGVPHGQIQAARNLRRGRYKLYRQPR